MGMIRIEIAGSFHQFQDTSPQHTAEFSAQDHGHAAAVGEAIRFLSERVLPFAIANDHMCAARNISPTLGYGMRP